MADDKDSKAPFPLVVAGQIASALEKLLDQIAKLESETSQTITWTVGISASMLALSVAQPDRMKAALGTNLPLFSVLLLFTIVARVLWRLLAMWVWQRVSGAILGLMFFFTGYVDGHGAQYAAALDDK